VHLKYEPSYFRAILNDFVKLLLDVFFEVATIVVTQSSPGLRLSIFIVFAADNVEIEEVQIVTLSLSLFTFKSIVAPSLGNVDDILTTTV
jgi:hypothetical protein